MSEPSSLIPGDRALPWIRLAGAIVLGFGLLGLANDLWHWSLVDDLGLGLGIDAVPSVDVDYEARERASRMLGVNAGVGLSRHVFGGASVALVLLAVAWHARRLRLPAGIAALGFACTVAYPLRLVATRMDPTEDLEALSGWLQLDAIAGGVAWGGALALVLASTRDRPRRTIALGSMAVGSLWALLHLYASFMMGEGPPPAWWFTRMLGLGIGSWIDFVGTLGLGLGLWLGSGPANDDEAPRFDDAAARGLLLARTALWWRVGLAIAGAGLAIAGLMAVQRASGAGSTPWTLALAPWLSYVEVGFGVAMVMGLGTVVLQQRSTVAAALAGLGGVLLLGATMGSCALGQLLHMVVHSHSSRLSSFGGGELRRYAELTAEIDPTLRGLGLCGMGLMLVGLIVLARKSGPASQLRAYRFLGLVMLFTAMWLYREAFAGIGLGVLLLLPVVLGAAIWMLLDLATFLREVAEGLDGSRASASPSPSPAPSASPAPSPSPSPEE